MTQKRAIKLMMAAGITRNTARLWHRLGTMIRLTNEATVAAAIHCGGGSPEEVWDVEVWYLGHLPPKKLRYEPPRIEIRKEN